MKLNSDEQTIKQWFRDARRRDQQHAPSFVTTLAAAQGSKRGKLSARRIVFAAIAVISIGGAALFFFNRSAATPDQILAGYSPAFEVAPIPALPWPPLIDRPGRAAITSVRSSSARRKPHVVPPRAQIEPTALLSFKWQSPTDFLLRTPGADLLKTVPRLADSIIQVNLIRLDQEN